jgi:hypothetical protein
MLSDKEIQVRENREREENRKRLTAKKWQDHEKRWNKEFGRPIKDKNDYS